MNDLFNGLDGDALVAMVGMLVGVVAIVSIASVIVIGLILAHRRKAQRDEMAATLKLEMIQRGMSAGEIERILSAQLRDAGSPMVGCRPAVAAAREPVGQR